LSKTSIPTEKIIPDRKLIMRFDFFGNQKLAIEIITHINPTNELLCSLKK
jgi:hypothetical protein